MKKILPLLVCILLFLAGCSAIGRMIGGYAVPTNVTIEGVTYRNGFYGELYPVFEQVGDIGSDTLQEEIVYDDGMHKFRRVNFKGHDWIHSYIGEYTGGTVYCAENEWDQLCDYYADPTNFEYYCGIGYYLSEKVSSISEIDPQKFDDLLNFGIENEYKPFDERSNEKVMQNVRRIPEAEFQESVCFYKVSNDGYFTTSQSPRYFVHDGKLLLIFSHDGGRDNGGAAEVVALDVPDELGQYFVDLMERYL